MMRTETQEIKIYDHNDVKNNVDGIKSIVLEEQKDIVYSVDLISENQVNILNEILGHIGDFGDEIYWSAHDRGSYASFDATIKASKILNGGLFDICVNFTTWKDLHELCGKLVSDMSKISFFSVIHEHYFKENHDVFATTNSNSKYEASWEFEDTQNGRLIDLEIEIEKHIAEPMEEFLTGLKSLMLKSIKTDIEHYQSEECILETIEASEYEFTSDGKIYA